MEVIVVPHMTLFDEGRLVDVDHDGRSVRVKLVKCADQDDATVACTGVAPPPNSGLLTVTGAGNGDVGKVIAVHLHPGNPESQLSADWTPAPISMLVVGCGAAVYGVFLIVQRRRRSNRLTPGARPTPRPT